VLPAARDLGVPPFVGRERSAPEREAQRDGERDAGAGDEWGPPVGRIERRAALLALGGFAVALSAAIAMFGLALTAERMLLVLLVPALALRRARAYLRDFAPFIALIILYAECRGLAHTLRPIPYYLPQLDAEKLLFGGHVPADVLQNHLWHGTRRWYDTILFDVTRVHSIVPYAFAFLLWLKRRALFYRFGATMLVVSFAAAVVFALFPAAPPWAASQAGYDSVSVERIGHAPSSLPYLTIFHYVDSNPYAAIPSLHAGYSFLIFVFVAGLAWRMRRRWTVIGLAALYPLAQSFAAVYTGNHYVVDLLIGYVFAAGALVGVRAFWRSRGWPE
jgi:membrane-associated phospholipid phosphatase